MMSAMPEKHSKVKRHVRELKIVVKNPRLKKEGKFLWKESSSFERQAVE